MAVIVHTPLPPFGGGSYRANPGPRPAEAYDTIIKYTQSGYCVKDLTPDQAPTPSDPANSPTLSPSRSLITDSVIRGGDQAGAQVVACHWDDDPHKTKYVAKIYDPLYYNFANTEHPSMPTDVVWHAERDFRVEAAAYQELQAYEARWEGTTPRDESKNIRGCYPAYFGSYSLKLKITVAGTNYTRTVPLLLTEHFEGLSMDRMIVERHIKNPNGRGFETVIDVPGSEDARIHAFALAAHSYLKLMMAGVAQADFAPRNIFLIGRLGSPTLRAAITDFNVAKVYSRMTPPRPLPESVDPVKFCAYSDWEDMFKHWLPSWFFTDENKQTSRMRSEFADLGL
jgi:hypothetical protein